MMMTMLAANSAIAATTPIFVTTGSMNVHRYSHTATLLQNGLVLIVGGNDPTISGSPVVASAELYDPATGLFSSTGNLNTARTLHTATLLPTGNVLIAGGVDANGTVLASAELYNPAFGGFFAFTTHPMTAARRFHSATPLKNGNVLIAGGDAGFTETASAEIYDFNADTFTATAGPMTEPRENTSAVLLPGGQVLISGPTNTADLYDPATNMFTATTGKMTTSRFFHASTVLGNGTVLIAGGATTTNHNAYDTQTAEVYDPSSGLFSTTGSMTTTFGGPTAIALLDGRVLLTGNDDTLQNQIINNLYDPETGQFSSTASLAVGRSYATATLLGNGMVLETGGKYSNVGSTAELGDFAPGTFLPANGMNSAREFHTATSIVGGGVFIAGGRNANGALASTEIYFDGAFLPAASMQNARAFHSGTFFGTNGVLQGEVTFGGQDQNGAVSDSTDFYQFTTAGGTPHVNATFPFPHSGNPRMGHGASYFVSQTAQPSIVVTGGIDASGHVRGDADVFAPSSWTPTAGTLQTGRAFHTSTALLDGTILLTGGKAADGSVLSSAEIYTPSTGMFALTTYNMVHPRMFHTATLMTDGQVLLTGGTYSTGLIPSAGGANDSLTEVATAEIYDPSNGTFTSTGLLTQARIFQSAAKLNDGDILISGGQSFGPSFTAEIFGPVFDEFAPTQGPMLNEHIGHTSTLLPNGLVLIAGGADSDGDIGNSSEFYDPPNGPGVNGAVATLGNGSATTGSPGHRVNAGSLQIANVSNMPESISSIGVHISNPQLLSSIELDATVTRVKDSAIARGPEASNTLTFAKPVSIPARGVANVKLIGTMAKRSKHLPRHAHTVQAVTTILVDGPSGALDTMGLPIVLNTVTLR
jgi:hypothetical protein